MEKSKLMQLDAVNSVFSDSALDAIFAVYRAMRIKDVFVDHTNIDQNELYAHARTIDNLPQYKGDSRAFYALFMAIADLSHRDCLEYFDHVISNDKRSELLLFPRTLADIMLSPASLEQKRVFIPDCEKYGSYLYDLVVREKNVSFTTSCRNSDLEQIYKYFFSGLNIRFINGDIYKYSFSNEKFDLIVCLPIMGGRSLFEEGDFLSKDPSLIAAQNLLYHLTPNGTLKIILPAKVTFSGGDTESFRRYIEDNYKIDEISSLPNKLFQPFFAINTYLISFSNGETEDIKLRKYSLDKEKSSFQNYLVLTVEDERIIFKDEFDLLPAWNVDVAFEAEDEEISAYANSLVKKSQIRLIATVFRGKSVTSKENDGIINVINISNITDVGIDYSDLDSFNEEERKLSRYILEDGDVLITSRGTTVKIAVFKKQSKPCVASSNINVIRPEKMIKGAYLKLFLDSSVGKKMLKSLQRGTTIVNINYKDIELLEVPIPPLDEQKKLIYEYEMGRDIYVKTIKDAEDTWLKIQKDIERKLY